MVKCKIGPNYNNFKLIDPQYLFIFDIASKYLTALFKQIGHSTFPTSDFEIVKAADLMQLCLFSIQF